MCVGIEESRGFIEFLLPQSDVADDVLPPRRDIPPPVDANSQPEKIEAKRRRAGGEAAGVDWTGYIRRNPHICVQ